MQGRAYVISPLAYSICKSEIHTKYLLQLHMYQLHAARCMATELLLLLHAQNP
jgi:hypothetical protein